MATRVLAIVAAVMVTGCGQRLDSFACTDDASCGAGGKCEPGFNLCSFADPDCGPDGRSFGSLAGAQHGQCVGSQPRPDGGTPPPDGRLPDGPPPDAAPVCYGAAPFSVCFATAPTGTIDVNVATTFDTVNGTVTGTSSTCVTPVSGGTGYCVLAANTITISSPLRAIGTKPLVLLAVDSITTRRPGRSTSAAIAARPSRSAQARIPLADLQRRHASGHGRRHQRRRRRRQLHRRGRKRWQWRR